MLSKDLVYAGRALRKSPVFAITAVITIALGIGASTAIFSVTNAVLLRPLPYKDSDRLVFACGDMRKRSVRDFPFSNADFFDLRNGTKGVFDALEAVRTGRVVQPREDGSPEQVRVAGVTPNFFRLMGGRIVYGRDFTDADGEPPPPVPQAGATQAAQAPQPLPGVAILSYEYWRRRYGANPAILGHAMLSGGGLGGTHIVGVLAPKFELFFPASMNLEQAPDIWFAARLAYDNAQRNSVSLAPVGRLKKGVTLEQAQARAEAVSAELRKNFLIERTADYHIRIEPMQKYLVAEARPAILALMGAVIFLLLIACANVANLLLVRASLRRRELSIRTALGGSRWRLVKQMLAETVLLAGIGTVVGVGLAWIGIHDLLAIAPANLPRVESIRIDTAVLVFAALSGLAAAVIFGVAPALHASRPDVMNVLRGSARMEGFEGGGILRNIVVIAEVGLCFVLLIGSGLMVRSFLALERIDLGYDPHHLLTFSLLRGGGPQPPRNPAFSRLVRERLGSLSGVQSVTAAFPFPLTGGFSPIRWGLQPALTDASKFQAVDFQIVLPGYFETLRTRLLAGRAFTETDNRPDRNLAMVDQILATKAFPNQSAVGKRILIRLRTPEPEWVEIIGVVAHQRESSLATPGREQIYFTDGFVSYGAVRQWALRTAGDPQKYAGAVRGEIAKLGGQSVITEMEPMDALVKRAQAGTRFSLLLISLFAVISALLAAVGLYGVLSTVVRRRTAEIGVRMAVGAASASIFKLVIAQGLRLSAIGVAAGLVAAFALTRIMTSMLVGVKATDPATFAVMAVIFFFIAAMASWIPAWRAAALDPTTALRQE